MALRLYSSNRMELLVEELATVLREPLQDVFAPETIVVQSRGMDRWLSMQLAGYHGVCANCRFPFPNALLDELFGPQEEGALFSREVMTLRIMHALPELVTRPEFASVRRYLEDDGSGLRLYQLARVLADTYDQYLIFRPEMIAAWENRRLLDIESNLEAWQAELWRGLCEGHAAEHRAARAADFLRNIVEKDLPERINLFGISYLPPVFLAILGAIGEQTAVNVFALNPCREFWGDIRCAKEQGRMQNPLYVEVGNPLLAGLGRQGRWFFDELAAHDSGTGASVFAENSGSALGRVQQDILDLVDPAAVQKIKRPNDDDSIRINSCHSELRELEVLHDELLRLLDKEPDLNPADMIVMAPDIEKYAPYVPAVFGGENPLPFSLADRSPGAANRMAQGFMQLLEAAAGRLTASEVMGLLDLEPVRRRFEISEEEVATMLRWVQDTNIRWGRDADFRAKLGLPADSQNTWRAGVDRLLLGYAMDSDRLFEDILPYADMEGEKALTLGKLAGFLDKLFAAANDLQRPDHTGRWSARLLDLLDGFFAAGEDEADRLQEVRDTLNRLDSLSGTAGFSDVISPDVIRAWLKDNLLRDSRPGGFLSGGITFCSMLPMRSIPFTVVCVLGLNHDAYPRRQVPRDFDLMGLRPRPGDRNKRDDDLYLFLETLLSARSHLYLSYVGQSIRDNSVMPPSVVLSGFTDYLESRFVAEDGADLTVERLVCRHRLQAFNPEYFRPGSKLFSYSQRNCDGAQALRGEKAEQGYASPRLGDPAAEFRTLDISDLVKFYRNPCRFLLRERLGVILELSEAGLNDYEPFELDALEAYKLKTLTQDLAGKELLPQLRARGVLPHGSRGDVLAEDLAGLTAGLDQAAADIIGGRAPADIALTLACGAFTVNGLARVYGGDVRLASRPAAINDKDLLAVWINHVVLNAAGQAVDSFCLGVDRKTQAQQFKPLAADKARRLLAGLLEVYWQGLAQPLHFFPNTSGAFARELVKNNDPEAAFAKAATAWHGGYYPGEGEDDYYRMAFGGTDPLDERFAELALLIWQPLLDNLEKGV